MPVRANHWHVGPSHRLPSTKNCRRHSRLSALRDGDARLRQGLKPEGPRRVFVIFGAARSRSDESPARFSARRLEAHPFAPSEHYATAPAEVRTITLACPSSNDLRQRSVFGSEALAHLV